MTHLQELYDAVKAGESRGLQIAILADTAGIECPGLFERAYLGNTQAAIDFVQAVLPEAFVSLDRLTDGEICISPKPGDWRATIIVMQIGDWAEDSDNPARALLLAALAAMIAKGEG